MTNSETLATLRTAAGALADMSFSPTSFVTTAMVNNWLNSALSRMHYALADSTEDYFRSVGSDITLVPGTTNYALPTDFYRGTGVDIVIGGKTNSLRRFMVQERNRFDLDTADDGQDYQYRFVGTRLELIPTPGTGTVRVRYVPQYSTLSADGTAVHESIPQGLEQYAAHDAAVKCRIKQGEDPSFLMAERDALWERFTDYITPRDEEQAHRVVDVSGRTWRERRFR